MKVLVTGGYGFIGSFVAERFYQEGSDVVIIDNLSSGNKKNVTFKHTGYTLAVEDPQCEEIFKNHRFDTVVHLAAQVSVAESIENPRLDAKSNLLGLSNILALSRKYEVKKLIFASSAAVYGNNPNLPLRESEPCCPMSPYGMSKWTGELYCTKWEEMYGLDTVCFRFSNVYGPRQGSTGEGGVISVFMQRLLQGKEIFVNGDGGQTRDFIYVEDVADAIYRSSYSSLSGIYNLSTNTEKSINDLVNTLQKLHGSFPVSYRDKLQGDIYRSVLDHNRLVNGLDWYPANGFEQGLAKTYEWFRAQTTLSRKTARKAGKKTSAWKQWFKVLTPFLENGAAFLCTAWLTIFMQNNHLNWLDFRLVYILVFGILYGSRQSIIAVALSTSLYVYQQLENGRELVSLMYDTDFFYQTAVYLFVGLVVGYTIERKNHMIRTKQQNFEALEDKYSFLNDVYQETRLVKDQLQAQIMNNGDSFGKIYTITKELESLEPEKIFTSTVGVVETIMKAKTVTIYTVNKYRSYLRLIARSAGDFQTDKSIKVEDAPHMQQVLSTGQPFVNKELQEDKPLMVAPVMRGGEVVAVICLQWLPFEHFTLYQQNLFKVLVDLISSALSRALSYVEATSNQRYIEGTTILKPEVFAEIVESKKAASAKHDVGYVLLMADAYGDNPQELSEQISRSLRETDYIGMDPQGRLLVLLANSTLEDASFVLQRFERNGISLQVLEEGMQYA